MALLKSSFHPGPDLIPSYILKQFLFFLSDIISHIFVLSINSDSLLSVWKKSIICPIFKKGDDSNPINYRPNSLLVICLGLLKKLFRSIIILPKK